MNEENLTEELTETTEVVEVSSDRPFLSTPLDEYTVTEGLLLLILFCIVLKFILDNLKGAFSWLR